MYNMYIHIRTYGVSELLRLASAVQRVHLFARERKQTHSQVFLGPTTAA